MHFALRWRLVFAACLGASGIAPPPLVLAAPDPPAGVVERREADLRPHARAGMKTTVRMEAMRGGGLLEHEAFGGAPRPPALDALGDSSGAWMEIPPPRRWSAHLALDAATDRLFLVGGRGAPPAGDLWSLSLEEPTRWVKVQQPGPNPPPQLDRASSAWDAMSGRLILFGGQLGSSALLNLAYMLTAGPEPRWDVVPFHPDEPRPEPRIEAATAYDPDGDRLVVFGGRGYWNQGNRGVFADTWMLDLSADRGGWTAIEPESGGPSERSGASAVCVPGTGRVLVYGGYAFDGPGSLAPSDELWELTLGPLPAWSKVDAAGDLPPAEAGHAAFWDGATARMILVIHDGSTHAYDPEAKAWSRVDTGPAPVGVPGPAVVRDPARGRYLFYDRDFVAIDPTHIEVLTVEPAGSWKRLATPSLPPGRFGHATVHEPAADRMLVFGGVSEGAYLADPWSLDLSDLTHWEPLPAIGSVGPPPRHEPVGIHDPRDDRAIFFGGWTFPDQYLGDVWEMKTCCGGAAWRRLEPAGDSPVGRRAHSAVYDPLRHRMLVFGGVDKDSVLGDLWALELGEAPRWTRLEPRGGGPGPLYFPALVYDALRDRVILHGGGNGQQSQGGLWALELDDLEWVPLPLNGFDLPLERHGLAHDRDRDRLLVFGGWSLDGHVGWSTDAVFTLDLAPSGRWGVLQGSGPGPHSRIATSWLHDLRRDRVVAFAGGGFVLYLNDVWSLDFTTREPQRTWLVGASAGASGARIVWRLTSAWGADVERREEAGAWKAIGRYQADAHGQLVVIDEGLRAGSRYTYRMRPILDPAFPPTYDDAPPQVTVTIPGGPALRLLGPRPNPARAGEVTLWFALDAPAGATIEILDVRGRRVWRRTLDAGPAGRQSVRPDVRLAAGLYFTRLRKGGDIATGKLVVVP